MGLALGESIGPAMQVSKLMYATALKPETETKNSTSVTNF